MATYDGKQAPVLKGAVAVAVRETRAGKLRPADADLTRPRPK
jgi:hypothetical protein